MAKSIQEALEEANWLATDEELKVIISTTKGNVDQLQEAERSQNFASVYLNGIGEKLTSYLGLKSEPLIISNACISGVLALNFGSQLLAQNKYSKVLVVGGDLVTRFTLSGFHCLSALDPENCKPYDKDRVGINLGEGIAAVGLSMEETINGIQLLPGYSTNDANHISGPSRTGEGLYLAVKKTLKRHQLNSGDISFINGHGTATNYNDEMESIAFERTNLSTTPINSFKGYVGHTLGAAGVIETALSALSLEKDTIFPSYGFSTQGTSRSLNVVRSNIKQPLKYCLKTASGFGGCNAALILKKA